MRLSEAIRLGALLKPQHFGDLWSSDGEASCALGAALDALGTGYGCLRFEPPADIDQWLNGHATCPVCGVGDGGSVRRNVITHLNDRHCWSRELIATWVAQQETIAGVTREKDVSVV